MSQSISIEQQRKLDRELEQPDRRAAYEQLGEALYRAFGGTENVSTQVRNLQQTAATARRFADIEAFVKNQMGRNTKDAKAWREPGVGQTVLDQLAELREIARQHAETDEDAQANRFWLARNWVRVVVGAYLYEKAVAGMPSAH